MGEAQKRAAATAEAGDASTRRVIAQSPRHRAVEAGTRDGRPAAGFTPDSARHVRGACRRSRRSSARTASTAGCASWPSRNAGRMPPTCPARSWQADLGRLGLTALLVVSLLGWSVGLAPSPEYVYFRAFNRKGRPCRLPDMTTAPHWDLRRRDFHPQVQQLASLHCLRLTVPPAGSVDDLACSAQCRTSWREPMPGAPQKDRRRANPPTASFIRPPQRAFSAQSLIDPV